MKINLEIYPQDKLLFWWVQGQNTFESVPEVIVFLKNEAIQLLLAPKLKM